MIDVSVTISNLGTTSTSAEVGSSASRAELAIVAIESPATLTSNTGTLEFSSDGSTWQGLIDAYGVAITFPLVQGKMTMVRPVDHCIVKRYVRLVTTNAVSADRVFKIYAREVE